jgi:hypothetical protein
MVQRSCGVEVGSSNFPQTAEEVESVFQMDFGALWNN